MEKAARGRDGRCWKIENGGKRMKTAMTGRDGGEAVQSGVLKPANNGEKRLLMEKDGIASED